MISETMCHHTESMNSLIRCLLSCITLPFFRYWNRKKRMIYVCHRERERERAHQYRSLVNESIWTPPPSQLFLQFVTVLLYTGFPLEQMWPSTVVWPLRYFMLNRHKVTCVSYLEEWALLFFMLVTSTNSHRYKTKSKF